ncbi:MAG: 50S ribosome-binding GTPase, partial [Desulfovibrionaceae bacterium]|nr:50S ribosome-binding GTPase [Desulfovibrionaceae bacterium]
MRVALAGNPNCGKTTVFNAITGARQHVGNYPGVTVDRKEGSAKTSRGTDILLVDLPGAYSLTAYTQEEIVVRDVLAPSDKSQRPCAVIDVTEAGALERHLYLTVQMLELGLPVVLLCNMADEARKAGMRIDYRLLSERLGLPVVEAVARTGEGLSTTLDKAEELAKRYGLDGIEPLKISYGQDLEPILKEMTDFITARSLLSRYPARWVALKLLERDERIVEDLKEASPS